MKGTLLRPVAVPLAFAGVVATIAGYRAAAPSPDADRPAHVVWTTVPDGWIAGLAALRDGDAKQALAELRGAESAFEVAPVELSRARLAAALAAADGMDAEATAEKLAMRTGAESLRAFVHGLAEHARCQLAARQAKLPGSDPGAFDRAIRSADEAARAFVDACLLHEDREWPAARRNAERVLALRQDLVRQREQQKRDQRREKDPDRKEPEPERKKFEDAPPPPEERALLTPADLQALFRRLATAENEKRGVRRAVRDARSAAVERDW